MFGAKPSYLLLVQRNGLLLQDRQGKGPRLTFDDAIMRNLEVLDRAKCLAQCVPFLSNLKNQRVVVVLDRPVIFDTVMTIEKTSNLDDLTTQFRASLPFQDAQRVVLTRRSAQQVAYFGINKDILSVLYDALQQVGARIVSMSPLAAYDKPDQALNKQGVVAHLLDAKHVTEDANFIKQ